MMNYPYSIKSNGPRSGRVVLEGREVFFDNQPPSREPTRSRALPRSGISKTARRGA